MIRRRILLELGDDNFVDLGLPSGTLWAKGNLCKTSSGLYYIGESTDYGAYFQYGYTEGHNSEEGYNFSTNNYELRSFDTGGLYLFIPLEYDAAYTNLGSFCRMPLSSQVYELIDNTDVELATIDGIVGYKFMKKTDHDIFVFFPASGYYDDTNLVVGTNKYHMSWASDTGWANSRAVYQTIYCRYNLYKGKVERNYSSGSNKENGLTVRPVSGNVINIHINTTDGSSNQGVRLKIIKKSGSSYPYDDNYYINAKYVLTTDSSGNTEISLGNGTYQIRGYELDLSISELVVSGDASITINATDSGFVDLGLSVLWAKGNICKDSNNNYYMGNPEDFGCYYRWGETTGRDTTYNFSSDYYSDRYRSDITPRINYYQNYDPGFSVFGLGNRMPTKSEISELNSGCNKEWTNNYNNTGVAGMILTSKTNGNSIFIPATGRRSYDSGYDTSICYSWTSSRYDEDYAYSLKITSSGIQRDYDSKIYKYNGLPVRPVRYK